MERKWDETIRAREDHSQCFVTIFSKMLILQHFESYFQVQLKTFTLNVKKACNLDKFWSKRWRTTSSESRCKKPWLIQNFTSQNWWMDLNLKKKLTFFSLPNRKLTQIFSILIAESQPLKKNEAFHGSFENRVVKWLESQKMSALKLKNCGFLQFTTFQLFEFQFFHFDELLNVWFHCSQTQEIFEK